MSLVSVLAASHAPNILLEPGHEWEDFMRLHYTMAPQAGASKPALVQQQKLRQDAEKAFAVLRADLQAAKPDVLIVVANDQFVNFFFNVIPTFFITLAEEVRGQFTRHGFHYKNHRELGRAILRAGLDRGIDFAFGEHVELQHTQTVPLYFLLPMRDIPILPIYVNTWVDPIPTPRRCYQVGELIRDVVNSRPERVAILATGGLSHFPGSPRIGEIDTEFDHQLLEILREGKAKTLADFSLEQLLQAGDSEFLNWMVALGTVGDAKASSTFYMPDLVATGWGFVSFKFGS
jgi:protocatechuate 4,5-dioxygenase beta chain/2,3-dihydroxyphenylpropionate 1,2-dioxygenase